MEDISSLQALLEVDNESPSSSDPSVHSDNGPMRKRSLEAFPLELIGQIAKRLPFTDLRNLREVSWKIRRGTAPELFKYVKPRPFMKRRQRRVFLQSYGKYMRCIRIDCYLKVGGTSLSRDVQRSYLPLLHVLRQSFERGVFSNCTVIIVHFHATYSKHGKLRPEQSKKVLALTWRTVAANSQLRALKLLGMPCNVTTGLKKGALAAMLAKLEDLELYLEKDFARNNFPLLDLPLDQTTFLTELRKARMTRIDNMTIGASKPEFMSEDASAVCTIWNWTSSALR